VAWSPDGIQLATGADDATVVVCRLDDDSSSTTTLAGHADSVWPLAWNPDGALLATLPEQEDGIVVLWTVDRAGQSTPAAAFGRSYGATAVAWSPDSTRLATRSVDGTEILWQVRDDDESIAVASLNVDAPRALVHWSLRAPDSPPAPKTTP